MTIFTTKKTENPGLMLSGKFLIEKRHLFTPRVELFGNEANQEIACNSNNSLVD